MDFGVLEDIGFYAFVVLQLILLLLLLRGFFRSYFVLFLYSLASVLLLPLDRWIAIHDGTASAYYGYVFWLQEVTFDFLLFLMVIVLINRTDSAATFRNLSNKILVAAVIAAVALPFLFGYQPILNVKGEVFFSGRWFSIASQILNFGAAVMNLMLWTALIASKRRDPQLFAVSAGLGVTVAGQAIFYGVRLLTKSPGVREAASDFSLLAQIVSTVIWCWAFRPSAKPVASPQGEPKAV